MVIWFAQQAGRQADNAVLNAVLMRRVEISLDVFPYCKFIDFSIDNV